MSLYDYYRWVEGFRYADPPITVVMDIDTGNPAATVARVDVGLTAE